MRRHLDAMRGELAGPKPSPLDKLLVDRILATHVQLLYFEAMETSDPTAENMRVARYRMERQDQAHRQFLSSVKMLATVRNLVARTQTIQVQLVNPPMTHSAVAPIVGGVVNGEQPVADSTRATRFNGVNRIVGKLNGHQERFGELLEPTPTK